MKRESVKGKGGTTMPEVSTSPHEEESRGPSFVRSSRPQATRRSHGHGSVRGPGLSREEPEKEDVLRRLCMRWNSNRSSFSLHCRNSDPLAQLTDLCSCFGFPPTSPCGCKGWPGQMDLGTGPSPEPISRHNKPAENRKARRNGTTEQRATLVGYLC
eukprot:scaffold9591_cov144-Cylindrotheca_fusiformis.AAC.2